MRNPRRSAVQRCQGAIRACIGVAHIDREFPANPLELCSIPRELLDAANVWFLDVYGIGAELVDSMEVRREHVWVLVIFGGDVLFDGAGEGEGGGFSEGNLWSLR